MVSFPLILQKRLKFLSQVEGSVQFIDERFPTCYACYRIFRALYEISRLEINFSAIEGLPPPLYWRGDSSQTHPIQEVWYCCSGVLSRLEPMIYFS